MCRCYLVTVLSCVQLRLSFIEAFLSVLQLNGGPVINKYVCIQ